MPAGTTQEVVLDMTDQEVRHESQKHERKEIKRQKGARCEPDLEKSWPAGNKKLPQAKPIDASPSNPSIKLPPTTCKLDLHAFQGKIDNAHNQKGLRRWDWCVLRIDESALIGQVGQFTTQTEPRLRLVRVWHFTQIVRGKIYYPKMSWSCINSENNTGYWSSATAGGMTHRDGHFWYYGNEWGKASTTGGARAQPQETQNAFSSSSAGAARRDPWANTGSSSRNEPQEKENYATSAQMGTTMCYKTVEFGAGYYGQYAVRVPEDLQAAGLAAARNSARSAYLAQVGLRQQLWLQEYSRITQRPGETRTTGSYGGGFSSNNGQASWKG